MRLQHPFKILRRFMKGHPELANASTQAGFAELVGCSLGLIQAVEQRTKITNKLAMKVQSATGVSIPWLSEMRDPSEPILAADGGVLTHETVLTALKQAREPHPAEVAQPPAAEEKRQVAMEFHPILRGKTSLMASFIEGVHKAVGGSPSWPSWKDEALASERRKAAAMGKFVEDELIEALSRGDYALWDEISRTLARHRPEADSVSRIPSLPPASKGAGDIE